MYNKPTPWEDFPADPCKGQYKFIRMGYNIITPIDITVHMKQIMTS